jgi:asparagine synthase (glutamine-hydrolysing)
VCGICGIVWADSRRPGAAERVQAMATAIAHRGPDDSGIHVSGPVALGHRRLSIVDLASGHQPMSNEDGRRWIVFNGEIYNHRDLRPALEANGHHYRTHSDTETIIHLHEERGTSAPAALRGMFAYALWDETDASLTLARDHTGIKPLYYAHLEDGSLVFGSEIKALAASGLVALDLDSTVVEEYMATGHVSGTRTLLRGVTKLPPGSTLRWVNGRIEIVHYWQVGSGANGGTAASTSQLLTPSAAAAEFWPRFVDAVQSQLMSDVPLGVFLSGGLDSSLLVAGMQAAGATRVQSFSVGYREAEASELPWARMVAKQLGTEHHEVIVDGADFFSDLPELTWHRDLPMTFSACIPLYHVSKLAREQVTVVLTGEGSDELFAGYGRYPRALFNQRGARTMDALLPSMMRTGLRHLAERAGTGRMGDRLTRSFVAADASVAASMMEPFADWHRVRRAELLTDAAVGDPWRAVERYFDHALAATRPLEALLRYDQQTYLEELLMKQDTMSMAASLESRVPFLDHLLVEWAAYLPASAKLSGATGKAVVREAGRAHLPREIVDGPKRGFLVPLDRWLRTVGRDAVERYVQSADQTLFRRGGVRRVVDDHMAGGNQTARLWRLLAFEVWRQDTLPRLSALAARAPQDRSTASPSLATTPDHS